MMKALQGTLRRETGSLWVLPPTKLEKWLLLILLLIAIFLRTAGLDWGLSYEVNQASPHHDEVHKIAMLLKDNKTFQKDFGEWEISRPVFFLRVFARPLFLLGEKLGINSDKNLVFEHIAARSVNATFGILGIILLYLLATKLAGPRTGLWAVALLTFLPGHWYYSQNIKFDLAIGTHAVFILLASIMLYERGTKFWYIVAGAALGIAVATKASALPLVPIPLLAHALHGAAYRPGWAVFLKNTVAAALATIIGFFIFYPYLFLDFQRWLHFVLYPTDALSLHGEFSPEVFRRTWNLYNSPERPLMEMAFGKVVALLFPFAALILLLQILWMTWHRKGVPLILIGLAWLLFYHSLSFWATGTRFLLPQAPLVVLALALVFELWPLTSPRWNALRWISRALGVFVVVYTIAYTWAIFPIFAFGNDVRVQAIKYLEQRVSPHDVVGEFEPNGRQSLPFDNAKVQSVEIRTHGEDPHIFLTSQPEYVVYQVEPENEDDAIRPQLYTPTIRYEFFDRFLGSYEHLARFGQEPTFFGRKLPRTIGTPVYEVWARKPGQVAAARSSDAALPSFSLLEPMQFTLPDAWSANELQGKVITITLDLTGVKKHWQAEKSWEGTLALVLLFDGATFTNDLPAKITEPDIAGKEKQWELLIPLHPETIHSDTATIKLYLRTGGTYEFSTGSGDQLIGQSMNTQPPFASASLTVAVTPREQENITARILEFSVNPL